MMKKYLRPILLMAVLISGCSPSDERPQADLHEALTVKMDVDGQDVYDVSALRFESGVLREVLPLEKSYGDNIYILEPSEISGRLYLLANSSALAAVDGFIPGDVTEEELMGLTAPVEEMTGQGLLMTGSLELRDNVAGTLPVSMRRTVARMDVAVAEAGIEVLSVEVTGLYGEGYVMPRAEDVSVPETAGQMRIVRDYGETPLTGGRDVLAYVPEQSCTDAAVEVAARLEGALHRLRVTLPGVLERNNVYTVQVSGNGAGLSALVLYDNWGLGPSSGSEYVPAVAVDVDNSVLGSGVRVNDMGDSVFVAYTGGSYTLVLSAARDAEIAVEGFSADAEVVPGDDGIRVTSVSRKPGSKTERLYLNVRQGELSIGRIVIVLEASPIKLGGMLALDSSGVCDFGRYVDGVLGTVSVPAGKIVTVEVPHDAPWMRADLQAEDDGGRVYRILGGWRPNDPTADGRTQEGLLVISDDDGGNREAYTVRRLNWGLPVARIGETWWAVFNLRGNARSFEDQITGGPYVVEDDLMSFLQTMPDDSLLALMGDQYQAGNPDGFVLSHNGSAYYYEGMKAYGGDFGLLDPAAMAPDGYQIPSYDDFAYLAASDDYNLGGVGTRTFTNRKGKMITVTIAERQAEFLGQDYGTVSFYEFESDGNRWVLFGLGHQWSTAAGDVARKNILLATYGSSGRSWGLEGYASSDRPGQNWLKFVAHNNTKTRTIRCVKTPVEYIY